MKNVLITGGSRGIGRAMVLEFCKQGYNTLFLYRSDDKSAKEVEEISGAKAIKCDVSDKNQVEDTFKLIHENCGGVDILVNNAGISSIIPFLDMTDSQWQTMMNVTLNGAYNCSKIALGDMLNKKWGRIINISSMWGQTGASCEVAYSTAKAGLIGMTKALALEFSLSGITVNCIAPGIIDTDMNSEIEKSALDDFVSEIPIPRLGNAYEVAKLACYLVSDDASYITGQVVGINGGMVT